jgi:co-chaperonin GroES (HSP10)
LAKAEILVKRIEAEEKTTGGIIIPDTAKEKPSQGARQTLLVLPTSAGPWRSVSHSAERRFTETSA